MKLKFVLTVVALFVMLQTNAQIMSPQLAHFNGVGTIWYPYGFYQGGLIQGVANGTGTFYYNNGTFFRGNFYGGMANGPGVIAVPYQGYITGCWSNGNFVGQCQQTYNPYSNPNKVSNIVNDVQNNIPSTASNQVQKVASNNYSVTEIDASTQLGQSLLGSYSPPTQ